MGVEAAVGNVAKAGLGLADLAVPGLSVVGQVAGAAMGGKGQKAAAQSQERSNAAALAFAREQEAAKKAAYDKSMEMYQQQWNAYQSRRDDLLRRLGVDVAPAPSSAPIQTPQAAPVAPTPSLVPAGPQAAPQTPQRVSLADIVARKGNLGSAFDWEGMGLRRGV